MADKTAATTTGATVAAGAQTQSAKKTQKPRVKPTHPRTSEMVNAAIKALKERGGSSLQAIKKYISTTYKVDAEKHAPFIKKYLKAAVATGGLVQTKGKGAAGSFRLASSKPEPVRPKVSSAKAAKKAPAAKKASPKKTPVKRKPVVEKGKPAKETKVKAPAKAAAAAKPKKIAKAAGKKAQPKRTTMPKARKPLSKKTTPKKK
ncbi:hypothetical protein KM043_001277 [Ampulex compressa]|nr:hypothetical protein KM043_001277 [Ampulex compressa]